MKSAYIGVILFWDRRNHCTSNMPDSWKNNPELKQISKRIKELRIEAGYTSYENFAIEFELGRKYYWLVEKGKAKVSADYLLKVLKHLNVKPSDFFRSLDL